MKKIIESNSEVMEITFLKKNSQSNSLPGEICQVEKRYALKLIEFGYARPTTEDDKNKPIEPPKEYTEVMFIRAHPSYSYSAGDFGTIESRFVEGLVDLGYVVMI